MNGIITPKELNVYSNGWNVIKCTTPKESNVDINVTFYKHAIPLGLD